MVRIINLGDAWPFPALTENRHAGGRDWFEISEEHHDYFLNVLPPRYFPGGFFCSEPAAHDERGIVILTAFAKIGGRYFARDVARDRIGDAMAELREALSGEAAPCA